MNVRADLAYNGTPFHGFARQHDVRSVQGDVEAALSKVLGAEVRTAAAGRTDAGVHALGQVVSFEARAETDLRRLRQALNGMLGPEIAINSVAEVPNDFHARFSARSRTYVYAIHEAEVHDPFLAPTTWHLPRTESLLDVDAMNEAAGHLTGPHDFSSFGRVAAPDASAERLLYELRAWRDGNLVRIRARANAFIQQMVRSLVGTLAEVGTGKRPPDEMPSVLEARDRHAAGAVAPPHGLCLVSVEYDSGWSVPTADA